uniref:Uncharacterized protein n=1 Tax=Saimiri boliviensis boliviensis TaxID=39432 RepID=A0A2K6STQ8_SAIBB
GGKANPTCAFHSRSSVLSSFVTLNDAVSDARSVKGGFELQGKYLQNPLEGLDLARSKLLKEDLKCFSQYPSLRYLKHPNLGNVCLSRVSLEPLTVLLQKVAATLETLNLEPCLTNCSQPCACLPALSHCSQLTTFCFGGKRVTVDDPKHLPHHTHGLSKLSLEMYPAPRESYHSWVNSMWTLREVSVFLGPTPCPSCGSSPSEELEHHLCC